MRFGNIPLSNKISRMNKLKVYNVVFVVFLLSGLFGFAQTGTVTVNQSKDIDELMKFKRDIRTNTI